MALSEHFTQRATMEIEELMETYETSNQLLTEALREAMVWVPGVVRGTGVPSAKQLFSLGTKALAIAYATEEEMKRARRKSGF